MKLLAPAVLFCCAGLLAQKEPKQNPPFQLPETVSLTPDIVYARYGARELHLDLYAPKAGKGPFPAVVFIHGGGWESGDKYRFRRQAALVAEKGFVTACIEYRLSGEAKFPAAVYDSKAAVRWMRANAARYRINPDKIGAAGGSAGGHLVTFLGVTPDRPEFEGNGGNAGVSSRVQAVVALYPVVDFVSFGKRLGKEQNSMSKFLGATYAEKPELWAKASPVTYLSKDSAPTLFMHGTEDQIPIQHSIDMMNHLKAAGVLSEIFVAKGAGHGFANGPQWFEPSVRRMEEFFIKTLK